MRIIGGDYRGRKLTPPANNDIRPTTDRMRETIFNILGHAADGFEGKNILDVFAGTGALGLEALSRGASHAAFFDKSRQALQVIKKNIALLSTEEKTTIACITSPKFPLLPRAYDIIFIDPPYHLDIIPETLLSLEDKGYLADDCLIVVEHSAKNNIVYPDFLEVIRDKAYGEAHVSFLQKKS